MSSESVVIKIEPLTEEEEVCEGSHNVCDQIRPEFIHIKTEIGAPVNAISVVEVEGVADVYQQQQQSRRNIQLTQIRPYSNAERQKRYREKRKADKVNASTTFRQPSDIQPQQEQPQHDVQINTHQPQSNAERQRKYRKLLREKQQQQKQMEDINAIRQQNVDPAELARKRHLNKQRQSRFRARQRFESPSTSPHQAQAERIKPEPSSEHEERASVNTWHVPVVQVKEEPLDCTVTKNLTQEEPEQLVVTPIIYVPDTSNNDFDVQPLLLPSGKYSCPICQKVFTTKGHAQRHIPLHSRPTHPCNICNKTFTREELLKKHITTQHERVYNCDECPKIFKSSSNLFQHKKSHLKDKPYFCEKCHRYFAIKANLAKHQSRSRCKRPVDEPIKCNICNKIFDKEFLLKSHLRRHTSEKPYSCDSCEMSFKYKSTLIRHVQLHKGEKLHMCEVCHKAFTHPGLIRPHMRIHTGEKPYECPTCKKKFSHKHNMQRHALRHEKIKHTTCTICNKKFPKESRLRYHMKIHCNEKFFECHVCPKKFSHKQNIMRHYSRKHPNESYGGNLTDAGVALRVWQEAQKKTQVHEEIETVLIKEEIEDTDSSSFVTH